MTTAPEREFAIRRDDHGFAAAIVRTFDGKDVFKLIAGASRNEEESEGILRLLNSASALRAKYDALRELVDEASEVPCYHGKECGHCFSCRARKALEEDRNG